MKQGNCFIHSDQTATAACDVCGTPLCARCLDTQGGVPTCSRCIALNAAREYDHDQYRLQRTLAARNRENGRKRRPLVQFGLIAICLLLVLLQLESHYVVRASKGPDPARPEEMLDQCLVNLWQISAKLQEGKLPDADDRCPASGAAYEVASGEGGPLVMCPTPELHDHRRLVVSRVDPIPRLIP